MESPEQKPRLVSSWNLLPSSLALVRQYFVPLLYVLILPTLLGSLGWTLVGDFTSRNSQTDLGIALVVAGALWTVGSLAAYYYVLLHAVRGQSVTPSEAYRNSYKYILRNIGLVIVYALVVSIGLLLLVVPGLIMLRRYYLAPYYLNDQGLTIRQAMEQSARDTKPVSGYIWGIIGVSVVFVLAGSVLNVLSGSVGMIAGTLLSCLYIFAPALRYKELSPKTDHR